MLWSQLLVVVACSVALVTCQDSDYELNLDPDTPVTNDVTQRSDKATDNEVSQCETKTGEAGVCISYYLCDQTQTVIEDGFTVIDIRAGSDCSDFLKVCCKLSETTNTTSSSTAELDGTPKLTEVAFSDNAKRPGSEGRVGFPNSTTPSSMEGSVGNCGFSNPGAHVFTVREGISIDNRLYADFGEFPWMVAILRRTGQHDTENWVQGNFIGGGSLIHPSVVLTVAHKVVSRKPEQIIIRAGEYDTNSLEEIYAHQDINVAKFIIHENFAMGVPNDMALLIMETPVILKDNPHIGIGCLSPQPPPPGSTCFSMGWGSSDFGNKAVFAAILKKVKLPIMERSQCERILKTTRLSSRFTLHPSLLCAGGQKNIDTCKGDGGSSLVCPIHTKGSRFAIYGMVAYGIDCGTTVPGVYVNTAYIYEWVQQQFIKEGLDTRSFTYT